MRGQKNQAILKRCARHILISPIDVLSLGVSHGPQVMSYRFQKATGFRFVQSSSYKSFGTHFSLSFRSHIRSECIVGNTKIKWTDGCPCIRMISDRRCISLEQLPQSTFPRSESSQCQPEYRINCLALGRGFFVIPFFVSILDGPTSSPSFLPCDTLWRALLFDRSLR